MFDLLVSLTGNEINAIAAMIGGGLAVAYGLAFYVFPSRF